MKKVLLVSLLFVMLAGFAGAQSFTAVSYTPPPCTGAVFADVACPGPYADWIEALYNDGITSGCGTGIYCPSAPLTREQAAVMLERVLHAHDGNGGGAMFGGTFKCGDDVVFTYSCTVTVSDPNVSDGAIIVASYTKYTHGNSPIPIRTFDVANGSFKAELQPGGAANYLVLKPALQ